jgi:hypothetical protein
MSSSWMQLLVQLALCAALLLLPAAPGPLLPAAALRAGAAALERQERHRSLVEGVMAGHASRLTAATWGVDAPPGAAPAPLFFLTAAAGWGKASCSQQNPALARPATLVALLLRYRRLQS